MNLKTCRTCGTECKERAYSVIGANSFNNILTRVTIKEAITMLVPEMAATLEDTEVVCPNCRRVLSLFLKFVQRCLEVEADLSETRKISVFKKNLKEGVNNRISRPKPSDKNIEAEATKETIKSENSGDHNYAFKIDLDAPVALEAIPDNIKVHSRIVSFIQRDPTMLNEIVTDLSLSGIQILDHSFENPSKRILLLTTSSRDCTQCKVCKEFISNNKSIYLQHMGEHRKMRRREARRLFNMKRQEENKKKFQETLKKRQEIRRRREEERKNVKAFNNLQCRICFQSLSSNEEFEEHSKIHPQYICEHCGKSFSKKLSLNAHYIVHNDPYSVICEICGMGFKTPSILRAHKYVHSERLFPCKLCNKKFKRSNALNRHFRTHEERSKQECEMCGKKVMNLRQHYLLQHIKPIKANCHICGEGFARVDYLKRHLRHHDHSDKAQRTRMPRGQLAKVWSCDICGKVFKRREYVSLHRQVHEVINRYKCKYCGLTFRRYGNKCRHEKQHEYDPYFHLKCPVCWKRFDSQLEIDEHVSTHPTPYNCQICHEGFPRKYLLNHHITLWHADEGDEHTKEMQLMFKDHPNNYVFEAESEEVK